MAKWKVIAELVIDDDEIELTNNELKLAIEDGLDYQGITCDTAKVLSVQEVKLEQA